MERLVLLPCMSGTSPSYTSNSWMQFNQINEMDVPNQWHISAQRLSHNQGQHQSRVELSGNHWPSQSTGIHELVATSPVPRPLPVTICSPAPRYHQQYRKGSGYNTTRAARPQPCHRWKCCVWNPSWLLRKDCCNVNRNKAATITALRERRKFLNVKSLYLIEIG